MIEMLYVSKKEAKKMFPDKKTVNLSLRLPVSLHEYLRLESFKRKVSMNALIVEAIEKTKSIS